MAELNKSSTEEENANKQVDRPLVSLPSIVLTRIDESTINSIINKRSPNKKSVKDLLKKTSASKVKNNSKIANSNKIDKPSRGRPKKLLKETSKPKLQKPVNNSVQTKQNNKPNKSVNKKKIPQIGGTKNTLNKSLLQKKSKIVIPQAKKTKLAMKVVSKPSPQKINKPHIPLIKSPISHKNPTESDSSEDEFLYDELIDEFESTFSKGTSSSSQTATKFESTFSKGSSKSKQKTTNITLKPSKGNKPPTIVKGGIIKLDKLPEDLKSITSPGQQTQTIKATEKHTSKKGKLPQNDCPVPAKKPSPWPISISKPKSSSNKIATKSFYDTNEPTIVQDKTSKQDFDKTDSEILLVETKPMGSGPEKRKIGPKGVVNIQPSYSEPIKEDDLSDEYTEEETLEDFTLDETVKHGARKSNLISANLTEHEDNLNQDLLRILTDESEMQKHKENANGGIKATKTTVSNIPVENQNTNANVENEIDGKVSDKTEASPKTEEPKVRTIYDLINELSLERPSWNLHIIPETNAFCIAQVTKGRLGLPTLKKCIELDPEDYSAKVYIHQYHIRRFDGVYDSEESILGLIDEIDSIKS